MKLKRLLLTLPLVCAMAMPAMADEGQSYAHYYTNLPTPLKQVSAPEIPARRVSLLDFGAKGDGATLATDAFRLAIDELAAQGGGHVDVPAGVYLSGPIVLKSHVDLHLDPNATIYFSPDASLFKPTPENKNPRGRYNSGITAENATDISITGGGIIDGSGNYWRPVKHEKQSDVEWQAYLRQGGTVSDDGNFFFPKPPEGLQPRALDDLRNDLVRLVHCQNVLLEGVTIQNSPRYNVHPYFCENLIIDGVTIRSPWNAQNADGIDLTNCRRALIVNTTVDTGDDGICMKAGYGRAGVEAGPVSDILVENCRVYHAHGGFTIGSDCSGGLSDIVVRRCTYSGTDVGLRFKSGLDRGGHTNRIFCDSIFMSNISGEAIIFENTYVNKNVKYMMGDGSDIDSSVVFLPDFADIHINNVVCRGVGVGLVIRGVPRAYIHDIDLSSVHISQARKPIDLSFCRDIRTENVTINGKKLEPVSLIADKNGND